MFFISIEGLRYKRRATQKESEAQEENEVMGRGATNKTKRTAVMATENAEGTEEECSNRGALASNFSWGFGRGEQWSTVRNGYQWLARWRVKHSTRKPLETVG